MSFSQQNFYLVSLANKTRCKRRSSLICRGTGRFTRPRDRQTGCQSIFPEQKQSLCASSPRTRLLLRPPSPLPPQQPPPQPDETITRKLDKVFCLRSSDFPRLKPERGESNKIDARDCPPARPAAGVLVRWLRAAQQQRVRRHQSQRVSPHARRTRVALPS